MNKAFLMIGIAIALLGACSGDQRSETSGATGPISPWHSLTEAEVRYLMANEWAVTAEDVVWRRSKLGLRLTSAEISDLDEWMAAHRGTRERSLREAGVRT